MNQFGVTAVDTANLLIQNPALSPEIAWDQAISNTTLTGETLEKGCPKHAFVGLAHCGLIIGCSPLVNVSIGWNGVYAIAGTWYLKNSKAAKVRQRGDASKLWKQVLSAFPQQSVSYNEQMEVVLALWVSNLL